MHERRQMPAHPPAFTAALGSAPKTFQLPIPKHARGGFEPRTRQKYGERTGPRGVLLSRDIRRNPKHGLEHPSPELTRRHYLPPREIEVTSGIRSFRVLSYLPVPITAFSVQTRNRGIASHRWCTYLVCTSNRTSEARGWHGGAIKVLQPAPGSRSTSLARRRHGGNMVLTPRGAGTSAMHCITSTLDVYAHNAQ